MLGSICDSATTTTTTPTTTTNMTTRKLRPSTTSINRFAHFSFVQPTGSFFPGGMQVPESTPPPLSPQPNASLYLSLSLSLSLSVCVCVSVPAQMRISLVSLCRAMSLHKKTPSRDIEKTTPHL